MQTPLHTEVKIFWLTHPQQTEPILPPAARLETGCVPWLNAELWVALGDVLEPSPGGAGQAARVSGLFVPLEGTLGPRV